MILERLPLGIYSANCYILACENTRESIVVDPGGEVEDILSALQHMSLKLKYIILTHAHGDHIGGLKQLKAETSAPVLVHEKDEELLLDANKNLSAIMSIDNVNMKADITLQDGEKISFGLMTAVIIHTPGHTPGGICIKVEDNILTGDTLFDRSIGRTDLYGGSYEELISSIKNRIMVYDDNVKLFPGHGPQTTIGRERINNPYIK